MNCNREDNNMEVYYEKTETVLDGNGGDGCSGGWGAGWLWG